MGKGVASTNSEVLFKFSSGRAAAGLFVLWRVAPLAEGQDTGEEPTPPDAPGGGDGGTDAPDGSDGSPGAAEDSDGEAEPVPENDNRDDFALGFCGFDGRLHDVTVANPWPLAVRREPGLGAKLGAEPLTWTDDPHQVVFVTHPSPLQAKQLLERLRQKRGPDGTEATLADWPILDITPKPEGANLVVEVPETPESFMPPGHDEFGGWTLYRRMPHADLLDVRKQIRKLAFILGQLRYPTDFTRLDGQIPASPYPSSPTSHSGAFDAILQSCLRRFQFEERARVAFQLSAVGKERKGSGSGETQNWAFVLGNDVSLEPRNVVPTIVDPEFGVVDADVGAELLRWQEEGLRHPGSIMVPHNRSRTFFARPRLWMAYVALEHTCAALGLAYKPFNGSHFQISRTRGPGIEFSFHKLGHAIDVENAFDEASPGLPLAFEADWTSKDELNWKLYVHSTLDVFVSESVNVATPLQNARSKIEAEFVRLMGDPLPLVATSYLVEVDALHDRLKSLATSAPPSGGGSNLSAEFFRKTVSRFLYQSGAKDYGTAQPPVGANADAVANAVANSSSVRSWLNMTRVAFELGLRRISAHQDKFGPQKDTLTDDGALTTIVPGAGGESNKAKLLDRLAGGIRNGLSFGLTEVVVETGTQSVEIPAGDFELDAMENWVRRASDPPGTLSRTPRGVQFVTGGVDLDFQVRFQQGPDRVKLLKFLDERASIKVRIVKIGDGIKFAQSTPLTTGQDVSLGDVSKAVQQATPVKDKKDHNIVVRPQFAPDLLDADPGAATYKVVKMHSASHLEWWHLELQPPSEAESWLDFAEQVGLDMVSYRFRSTPKGTDAPTASNPIPWMGGGYEGRRKPKVPFQSRRSSDPKNDRGRGIRPTS